MTVLIINTVFLVVSLVSLLIQAFALGRLRAWPATRGNDTAVYRGLLRTSVCRVVAAGLYVLLGTASLLTGTTLALLLALSVFTGVQLLWWGNATADVRLRRRLAHDLRTPPPPPSSPNQPT